MRTHPIVEYYQALRDSAPCLSRAATLPKGTKLGLGKRRAPGNTIILSQPYRRRVSTDRLNREGSQLAASLEGEPGPTPAGKTLPHSFPETSRFRRERASKHNYCCTAVNLHFPRTYPCINVWSMGCTIQYLLVVCQNMLTAVLLWKSYIKTSMFIVEKTSTFYMRHCKNCFRTLLPLSILEIYSIRFCQTIVVILCTRVHRAYFPAFEQIQPLPINTQGEFPL